MSLCTEWTLRKLLPGERQAKPLHCRSWECGICKPRRTKQLVALAKSGDPNRFLTLTTSPEAGDTPEDAYEVLQHAWKLFCKRIKRLPGFGGFAYLWVVEATKAGRPHLHVLLRCAWIDHKLISEWFEELAQSPIVHIEAIKSTRKAAAYVAKYVAKKPARFGNSKRYFASRDYEVDKLPKLAADPNRVGKWELLMYPIGQLIQEWTRDGWIQLLDRDDRLKFVPADWRPP